MAQASKSIASSLARNVFIRTGRLIGFINLKRGMEIGNLEQYCPTAPGCYGVNHLFHFGRIALQYMGVPRHIKASCNSGSAGTVFPVKCIA